MIEMLVIGSIVAALAKMMGGGSSSASSTTPTMSNDSYDFDYRFVDGEWRAYIRRQPGYAGRDDDLHSTHRHRDSGGHYVCWTEPIASLEDCEAIAKQWARSTDRYIRTGESF